MKLLITVVISLLFSLPAYAQYSLKLDVLSPQVDAVGIRELHDGNWLAGLSKQVVSLQKDGSSRLHLNMFSAWRAEGGDVAYGLGLGVPLGSVGQYINDVLKLAAPSLEKEVKWIPQLANFISLDVYTGYRLKHGPDVHAFIYGVGGKVRIPFNLLKGL